MSDTVLLASTETTIPGPVPPSLAASLPDSTKIQNPLGQSVPLTMNPSGLPPGSGHVPPSAVNPQQQQQQQHYEQMYYPQQQQQSFQGSMNMPQGGVPNYQQMPVQQGMMVPQPAPPYMHHMNPNFNGPEGGLPPGGAPYLGDSRASSMPPQKSPKKPVVPQVKNVPGAFGSGARRGGKHPNNNAGKNNARFPAAQNQNQNQGPPSRFLPPNMAQPPYGGRPGQFPQRGGPGNGPGFGGGGGVPSQTHQVMAGAGPTGAGPFRPGPGHHNQGPQNPAGGNQSLRGNQHGPSASSFQMTNQPRNPPPPGATYEYHPHHWVTFMGPATMIAAMPPNSRLFMGNLASERVDRKEMARIFAPYGNIVEIILKGSFGFVQFDNPESCHTAMQSETGRQLAGMRIDLKIAQDRRAKEAERQRAPGSDNHSGRSDRDSHQRGGRGRRGRSSSVSSDDSDRRYRSRGSGGGRPGSGESDRRGGHHGRRRSASPDRDSRSTKWGSDASPSNSGVAPVGPPATFGNVVLPKPVLSTAPASSGVLPLPTRSTNAVPECQIIVIEEMDRNYVASIESTMRNAGVKVDTLRFNKNMSLRDVVYQQMLEGVRGVLFLERRHAVSKTVSLQIFQPFSQVAEYENVNPEISAMLLLRDRSLRLNAAPAPTPGLAVPSANAGLANVLAGLLGGQGQTGTGGMDGQGLLALATALQQQQQQQQQQALLQTLGASGLNASSLAALGLGGLGGLAGLGQ
ncbi:hypothetical protein HKX48_000796, partial [Thoreauomyces humboldtii]